MDMIICTVRDRATDTYLPPFFVRAVGEAVRWFGDEVNGGDSPMAKHPDDYDLYTCGTFDSSTGLFTCDGAPRMIAIGKEHVLAK